MLNEKRGNEFLGTEPIGKLLFRLSVPTIAAQLINMLYNLADRIFIGRIPEVGSLAFTGVGVCMPLIMLISAFAALVSSGGAPRASILMGKGDYASAERVMGNCFCLQLAVSAVLATVLLLFCEPLLLAFGASPDTIGYAVDYMRIYAVGTVFVELTLGMNAYITAQGFSRVGMITVLIGAVLNVALDPILIYALGMGVRGAALATVISQGVSCAFVLWFLFGKRTVLRLRPSSMGLSPRVILPCVALGAAPFMMQASESVIFICFNSSLQSYGGDIAVGAMTILTSVMQFALLPLQGLAMGAQPITSYNYGAGHTKRVVGVFKLLLVISLSYSFLLWGAVMLFPTAFASLFATDPSYVSFAAEALRIYCAVLCIFGAQIACQMTFVSLGKALSSVSVAVMRKFVLLLPLIYLMPSLMEDKTRAVYMAEPIADVLAVTFTVILFAFQFKSALGSMPATENAENDN